MTSFNRTLMRVTASDLTARTDPQGVEKYVAGLSVRKPNVHEMQSGDKVRNRSKRYNPKIGVIDMIKGVATFYYGRNVDFEDIDKKEQFLKDQGHEITSAYFNFNKEDGISYIINFEPRDLVA